MFTVTGRYKHCRLQALQAAAIQHIVSATYNRTWYVGTGLGCRASLRLCVFASLRLCVVHLCVVHLCVVRLCVVRLCVVRRASCLPGNVYRLVSSQTIISPLFTSRSIHSVFCNLIVTRILIHRRYLNKWPNKSYVLATQLRLA
jgi:hypothetical protein